MNRNIVLSFVALAGMSLSACGIAPEDVAGTYVGDASLQYTVTCTPDLGTNGTTSLEGLEYVLNLGTESDLEFPRSETCKELINIEGNKLVKVGTSGDCNPGAGMTNTITGDPGMTWKDNVLTFNGTETASLDYEDPSLTDYSCAYTYSGTATKE